MSLDHSADPPIDWEDAFQNGAYIENAQNYPDRWAAEAEAFRATQGDLEEIGYGDHERERFDLFRPASGTNGLAVFVHGGYWKQFDKSWWSHLASGALARGWAVMLPSYPLAPDARIAEIVEAVGRAVERAATMVDGPICLSGHSAGGHIVSRLACRDTVLRPDVANRLRRIVSISGLHDLRPLRFNSMNVALRIDDAEALSQSPALLLPLPSIEPLAWVGAAERPEFLRQSALLAEAWTRAGVMTRLVADPGCHHFDVIAGLGDPDHPLTKALVDL